MPWWWDCTSSGDHCWASTPEFIKLWLAAAGGALCLGVLAGWLASEILRWACSVQIVAAGSHGAIVTKALRTVTAERPAQAGTGDTPRERPGEPDAR